MFCHKSEDPAGGICPLPWGFQGVYYFVGGGHESCPSFGDLIQRPTKKHGIAWCLWLFVNTSPLHRRNIYLYISETFARFVFDRVLKTWCLHVFSYACYIQLCLVKSLIHIIPWTNLYKTDQRPTGIFFNGSRDQSWSKLHEDQLKRSVWTLSLYPLSAHIIPSHTHSA